MDYSFETEAMAQGYSIVCGTDEAGRGPLAGSVYAAAVILPTGYEIEGLNDSKKLTEKKREKLFDIIIRDAISYGIAEATAKVFRGEAVFTHVYGMGPLVCDEYVADCAGESMAKVGIDAKVVPTSSGTEDFTAIAAEVPAVMINLGASPEGVELFPHHNPKMVADEAVMPYGAAAYVQCAVDYLNK